MSKLPNPEVSRFALDLFILQNFKINKQSLFNLTLMSAEEREEEIELMLKKLEKESKNLKGKLKEDESRARKKIANLVEICELTIESFRLEFGRVDEVLRGKSKEYHSKLDGIKSQIEKTINSFFSDSRHKK